MRFNNRTKKICVLSGLLFFLLPNLVFGQPTNLLFGFMYENSKILSTVLSKFEQRINFENPAVLMVAPTMEFPIKNWEYLESAKKSEALIASFYTIQPFQKFRLEAGVYGIILTKTKSYYEAVFVDPNGKRISSVQARVTRSEKYYPKPIARFNFNSPGMEICFDNICIEI